ncbi:fibronectin type III domain-containing protein [Trujillonella humicola]|uniref:fibronectin type III domain-containing protein n=1 Tax=Trujillonella humicola TaxID=3383699 RepID=UPI0039064DE8
MHLAPPSRRALGLAAVTAVATSTTLVALGGVAAAEPGAVGTADPWSVTHAYDGETRAVTLPAGYCAVAWHLEGAQGGAGGGSGRPGAPGSTVDVVTLVDDPTQPIAFLLAPGEAGGAATGGLGGEGGVNPHHTAYSGSPGYDEWMDTPAGGGGGAASVVSGPSGFWLTARGGDGGGDPDWFGHGGFSWTNEVFANTREPAVEGVDTDGGAGSISATGILCAPGIPTLDHVTAGERVLVLDLVQTAEGEVDVAGYEYTVDGGATWRTLATTASGSRIEGTITGLSSGVTYTVQVRAVGANGGRSEPSQALQGRPHGSIAAPTGVTVATTPSSLLVRWQPPAGTDTVTGYDVGFGTGMSGGRACVGDATLRSCVIAAQPGADYSVTVYALDANGDAGMPATVHVGVVPAADSAASFPSSVPAKSGDLGGPAGQSGSVTPGSKITLTGSGYLANSTVTLLVYSSPQVLGTVVADANGAFSVTVEIPAGLAAGSHTLVAAGVDAAGNPRYLTMPITVTAAGAAAGSGGLAYTGADVAVPALGGLAALALGGGLVLAGRRKRAAQ